MRLSVTQRAISGQTTGRMPEIFLHKWKMFKISRKRERLCWLNYFCFRLQTSVYRKLADVCTEKIDKMSRNTKKNIAMSKQPNVSTNLKAKTWNVVRIVRQKLQIWLGSTVSNLPNCLGDVSKSVDSSSSDSFLVGLQQFKELKTNSHPLTRTDMFCSSVCNPTNQVDTVLLNLLVSGEGKDQM